jgi:hypothetical protein
MNIIKLDCRRSKGRKIHLEYLDDRIVPSTAQLGLAAVQVATAHATVNVSEQAERTATAETKLQIRHENRIIKLEERREAATEKRDARLEKLAARRAAADRFSPAIVVRTPASLAAAMASASAKQSATVSTHVSGGSIMPVSSTGSPPASTTPVAPVTTTPAPVSSTPAPVSSGAGSGSSGSPTTPTSNPLPDNVSTILDTIYSEYENGNLSTTTGPGQVEIQGSSVGVQMRTSNPADFAAMVSDVQSMGMQVTTSSAAYDTVIGFLPISELPAAAQLTGAPAITPLLYPGTN